MAVHGVTRSTFDLDLLTSDPQALLRPAWASLERRGVRVDVRVGDGDDPLVGVARFTTEETTTVDLIVGRGAWQAAIVGRARPHQVEGVVVPVASVADLIALKLYAGGPQDAWDVEQLLQTGDRAALRAAVEALLPSLPDEARSLWARIGRPR